MPFVPVPRPAPANDEPFDWTDYERSSNGHSGRVQCKICGAVWIVPKCWLSKPSPSCRRVLADHRQACALGGKTS